MNYWTNRWKTYQFWLQKQNGPSFRQMRVYSVVSTPTPSNPRNVDIFYVSFLLTITNSTFFWTHTFSFVFFSLTLFQLGDSCGTWSMYTSSLLSHVPFSLLRVWFLGGSQTARSHTIGLFQCGFSTIFSIDYKLLRLTYHSRENFAIRTFSTIFRNWSVFPSMLFSSVSIEIIFFRSVSRFMFSDESFRMVNFLLAWKFYRKIITNLGISAWSNFTEVK